MRLTNKQLQDWQLPAYKVQEFLSRKTKYCIGIPVINEDGRICAQLKKMLPYSKLADILIFDGGSTDGSLDQKFLKKYNVRTLLTKTSPGKQGTQLRMGCAYALKEGYEGIIILDGNDKDGVQAIPQFITALEEGYDYVQGSRFLKGGYYKNTPLLRLFGVRLLHSPLMSLAARRWYTDTTNGFRSLSRRYLLDSRLNIFRDIFVKYEFHFYITARANQLKYRTKEIPVSRVYPKGGVPTKIHGIKGNIDMLWIVVKIIFREYHPK